MNTADPLGTAQARTPRIERAVALLMQGLWHVALPGLLALSCLRFLVPTPGAAQGTWAAPLSNAGESFGAALGLGLFVGFALLARYWGGILFDDGGHAATRDSRIAGVLVFAAGAAALAIGLRTTAGSYRVVGTSMLPTLAPDDVVLGNRLAYRALVAHGAAVPRRGDLVVFRDAATPGGSGLVVKRVFGLPGDRIQMNGMQPVINGWQVPHCDVGGYFDPLSGGGGVAARLHVEFLDGRAHLALYAPPARLFTATYVVKPGEVFVLGDNRVTSADSRAWNDGNGGGLELLRIEARVASRLAGMRRDERYTFDRLLRPFELDPHVDGIDTSASRAGIERCLRDAPEQTTPPRADVH